MKTIEQLVDAAILAALQELQQAHEKELAAVREDSARLDWLTDRGVAWKGCYGTMYDGFQWEPGEWAVNHAGDVRAAIDAAMKGEATK